MSLISTDRFKGASALFGAAVIYSTFGILIRVMSDMFGDYAQVAARMILAFVIILALNWFLKRMQKLSSAQLFRALLLGFAFAAVLAFFTISITQTKIANAVFLLYAASMITSLVIGTVIFKESLGFQKIAAFVLAILGLFMYSDVILAFSIGIIAGILSGAFEGIANAIRKSLQGVDRPTVLQYQFFGAALLASLVMFFFPDPIIKEVSLWPIVATVIFAILQIKLGDLLLYGFQHFDVNIGTVILATELFFAAVLGYVFFNEVLTMREMIGGAIIFVASIIAAVEFKKKAEPAS